MFLLETLNLHTLSLYSCYFFFSTSVILTFNIDLVTKPKILVISFSISFILVLNTDFLTKLFKNWVKMSEKCFSEKRIVYLINHAEFQLQRANFSEFIQKSR